jgi:hypothetical protein
MGAYACEIDAHVAVSAADVDYFGVLKRGPGVVVAEKDGGVVDCKVMWLVCVGFGLVWDVDVLSVQAVIAFENRNPFSGFFS